MAANPIRIIAEAGVNHNGSLEIAKKLIDVAAAAGADYVKFQTFITEKVIAANAPKAEYQKNNNSLATSQLEMLKQLELSEAMHHELQAYCTTKKIKFLSTAFDLESIELLHKLNLDFFKIPSGEITNKPLLQAIAKKGKEVLLSTGMCYYHEIEEAVNCLLQSGMKKEAITLLHCTTEYPAPFDELNLNALQFLKEKSGLKIGYSDHSAGIEVAIAAAALGAQVIEKHFTLDKTMPGPDHQASLTPDELHAMIKAIRNIEHALGTAEKMPSASELKNRNIVRKSIHLKHKLLKNHILTAADLEMKRPGNGISPMDMEQVIGKKIKYDLEAEHQLSFSDLDEL